MADIVLPGCAPVPLAAYLKALGVFRLVAEQKDARARGFWRNETFVLDTTLTEDELCRFFLESYRPSPIISPWNGGSGFYFREGKSKEKDPKTGKKIKTGVRDEPTAATRVVDLIAGTKSNRRLQTYRLIIGSVRQTLKTLGFESAPSEGEKQRLVAMLRASLPDESLAWLDAALTLTGEDLEFPPLLGSGGNDGNLDFSTNFMQRLVDLIDAETGAAQPGAAASFGSAVFARASTSIGKGAVGQFAPGAAGGPNATAGFERDTMVNPWDYVLMLEGALLFAASTTRRLHGADGGALSYPFTVLSTGAAGSGAALTDEGDARGEIWVPLWERPATFSEIRALLAEGRATLGRRPVKDGLDFARSVAALGINRGVAAFQRYGFLQRSGKAYVAAPLSRLRVRRNPKADLLNDLDEGIWLQRCRSHARGKEAPARLKTVGRRLDEAIFALTQDGSPGAVQRVLIAVGEAAAYLATSPKAREALRPPPRLSPRWFTAAYDGTPEFRIAAALASLGQLPKKQNERDNIDTEDQEGADTNDAPEENGETATQAEHLSSEGRSRLPPPFYAHLAPLDEKFWYRRFRAWNEGDRLAVWGAGALERNLIGVIERRLLFATQHSLHGRAFEGRAPADIESVLAFLERDTDDARIAALAQGLAWANPPNYLNTNQKAGKRPMPLAYALLKPFFASQADLDSIKEVPTGTKLPVPPGLVPRLRAGDVGAAVALACRRAVASGLPPIVKPKAPQPEHLAGIDGPRLLASLMIPIRPSYQENGFAGDLKPCLERAYPDLFESKDGPNIEETTHAA